MDASNPSSSSAGLARPAWNKGKFTARSRHCGWGMCGPFEPGCNWTPFARLGPVQSRDRQQAAWLRPCRGPRRRCGSQRLRNRSGHRPSEKDRPASSFRVNRGNQAGGGRLPSSKRFDAGPIPLPRALRPSSALTTRQYARLVSQWVRSIGLDPLKYATHSMRRTKATLIYRRTGNLRAVQLLLGHQKIESTVRYLGVEVDDALEIAEKIEI
jgi:hypothetical protein